MKNEPVQKVEEDADQVDDDHDENDEEEKVNDWSKDNEQDDEENGERKDRKSVCDFERATVVVLEANKVSEVSSEDLLKVLMCRGEKDKNPVLVNGCGRVLKQINREPIPRQNSRPFMNRGSRPFRGRPNFGRGNSRGFGPRGMRFNDDEERGDRPDFRGSDDERPPYRMRENDRGHMPFRGRDNRENRDNRDNRENRDNDRSSFRPRPFSKDPPKDNEERKPRFTQKSN